MNREQKKFLIVSIVIVIMIIMVTVFVNKGKKKETENLKQEEYTIEQSNGDKVNTSEALKKARTELGYYIKNITLERKGAQTIFKIDIENQSSETKKGKLVDIVFINKDGSEESRMALYIREIKAGETITTQATINNDFTNVYNFKLTERTNTNK